MIKLKKLKMKKQKQESSTEEENPTEELEKQIQQLEYQLQVLADLNNLKDESFYRRQMLVMLERQATATEKMAVALENSLEEEEDEDEVPDIEPAK